MQFYGHIIWEQKHDFLFLLTLVTDTFTITNNDDFGITCDRKSRIYEP